MSEQTFEATKIRLASPPPSYCSSCYGQYTERRHVDFGAAYDGPVLEGVEGGVPASIDDLVICEECLAAAAKVIGYDDAAKLNEQIAAQADQLGELTERLAGAMAYANKLEAALQSKPEPAKRGARKQ
jgi:hypothetical protein